MTRTRPVATLAQTGSQTPCRHSTPTLSPLRHASVGRPPSVTATDEGGHVGLDDDTLRVWVVGKGVTVTATQVGTEGTGGSRGTRGWRESCWVPT